MLLMVPWMGLGAARPQGLWRDIMLMMHPLVRWVMRQALMLTVLLLTVPLSGCFGQSEPTASAEEPGMYPDIYERHTLEWNWTGSYARVLEDGPHQALPVQEAFIEVDTTGTWEGGPNTAEVHLSYWLPSNTEDGEQVPVIAVVSPYFDYGSPGSQSSPTNVVSAGRGEFIYDNFVPHGYALAQVAVFATEESTGCFDYRGDGEGQGIHEAVEWLGTQDWSNGHVAIYGKSYEGATAWEAAAQGSEYLKTIVPISGTTALGPLLYKNGSAEARSQVMHSNYGGSILDYSRRRRRCRCAESTCIECVDTRESTFRDSSRSPLASRSTCTRRACARRRTEW